LGVYTGASGVAREFRGPSEKKKKKKKKKTHTACGAVEMGDGQRVIGPLSIGCDRRTWTSVWLLPFAGLGLGFGRGCGGGVRRKVGRKRHQIGGQPHVHHRIITALWLQTDLNIEKLKSGHKTNASVNTQSNANKDTGADVYRNEERSVGLRKRESRHAFVVRVQHSHQNTRRQLPNIQLATHTTYNQPTQASDKGNRQAGNFGEK
jgi:hypothetical protein